MLPRMPVTSGTDRGELATPERSLAYVQAVQKKKDFVRKSKELVLPAVVTGSSHGPWCPLSASRHGGADKQSCATWHQPVLHCRAG